MAVLLVSTAGEVGADGNVQVGFSPSAATPTAGEQFNVDVTVAKVAPEPGLASYDLILSFDPSVVRLESLSDSGFVPGGELVVICVTGEIDNVGGSVNATCTAIPLFGAPGVSTSEAIPLLHASFAAVAPGVSQLELSGALFGPDGEVISADFETGTVTTMGDSPATMDDSPAVELPSTGSSHAVGSSIQPMLTAALVAAVLLIVGAGLRLFHQRRRAGA